MVYIDKSVLVAYYCPEPLSEKAEKFLMSDLRPAISSLTEVEFFSAVSGKVRKKEINLKDAKYLPIDSSIFCKGAKAYLSNREIL